MMKRAGIFGRLAMVVAVLMAVILPLSASADESKPLKIAYSDWPGWVAWEIAIKKGWFKEEGVDVEFLWFDYVPSMDAYAAGKVDAVCMTNGDALVTGGVDGGKRSVAIIINDFSNGNDMLVTRPGITDLKQLKGKKVGAELGFVAHLLAITALESVGLSADDVAWVNVPTDETPQVLASGDVDAVAAWQPSSGAALKNVNGAKALFTSASAPGIIYDMLCVSPESLEARRADWLKVVKVWYRVVDYLKDEDNWDDALDILSKRVGVKPAEYEPFFDGTYILPLDEVVKVWEKADGLKSIYGSTDFVNAFNVSQDVYGSKLDVSKYLDPSLTMAVVKSKK